MPVVEVMASDRVSNTEALPQNQPGKVARTDRGEVAREFLLDDRIKAKRFQNACLDGGRGQPVERAFRPEHGARMRFEGQNQRRPVLAFGNLERLGQNGLMAAMNTVEIADCGHAATKPAGDGAEIVDAGNGPTVCHRGAGPLSAASRSPRPDDSRDVRESRPAAAGRLLSGRHIHARGCRP